MSSSSSPNSSSTNSNFSRPIPSLRQLNDLVRDENVLPFLNHTFPPGNVATSDLGHFASLSRTIQRIEQDLRLYREEQEVVFHNLQLSQRYQIRIRPVFRYYHTIYPQRAHRRTQRHPYNQPGRATQSSASSSTPSTREVVDLLGETPVPASPPPILPETVNALHIPLPPSSSSSPTSSTTNSSEERRSTNLRTLSLGTQEHPIVLEDSDTDEFHCTRCGEWGHFRSDCDARIRPPPPCETCAWTRQTNCDHYEPSPAWIRRQQEIIDRRG
jgi:hypothetical protein